VKPDFAYRHIPSENYAVEHTDFMTCSTCRQSSAQWDTPTVICRKVALRRDATPYEEVFGEKVRALAERTRPRDLYDVPQCSLRFPRAKHRVES